MNLVTHIQRYRTKLYSSSAEPEGVREFPTQTNPFSHGQWSTSLSTFSKCLLEPHFRNLKPQSRQQWLWATPTSHLGLHRPAAWDLMKIVTTKTNGKRTACLAIGQPRWKLLKGYFWRIEQKSGLLFYEMTSCPSQNTQVMMFSIPLPVEIMPLDRPFLVTDLGCFQTFDIYNSEIYGFRLSRCCRGSWNGAGSQRWNKRDGNRFERWV